MQAMIRRSDTEMLLGKVSPLSCYAFALPYPMLTETIAQHVSYETSDIGVEYRAMQSVTVQCLAHNTFALMRTFHLWQVRLSTPKSNAKSAVLAVSGTDMVFAAFASSFLPG
eukprot:3755789-Rhodomonas_salina.1